MADPRERQFQDDVVDHLTSHGWLLGEPGKYDRELALYTEDLVAFFGEAHPRQWEKFCRHHPENPEHHLAVAVARQMERQGTLHVLRHGFKDRGTRVRLCQFRPDHGMNPDTQARYEANRLRVIPEVSYSPHAQEGYNPRLDLVLFVNGLPTATLELKSEFKQAAKNAERQYRYDRPPKDPKSRKPEPLLGFKRGALVHFAVSQHVVSMTTKLVGKDTRFLPFNRGTENGGAGNPPATEDRVATAYLWEQVFDPDEWLHLLGRFLHLEVKTEEDFHGRRTTKETLIFPRFHQWDCVERLVGTTREEGPGQRYLVQHSAGSGKSNSIAWTAHQLASLYDGKGHKLFSSVIVVTDRTVLDEQLQETIYQFEHAAGVVRRITREEGQGSKSEQLAEALAEGTPIIVVTLQTFPFVLEQIEGQANLRERNFAVIADEAHSSQTGRTAAQLRRVLGASDEEDEDETDEDVLNRVLEARGDSSQISYYAFTATPKGRTMELFGRPPDPSRPPAEDNKPEAFHVYSMRQAIEESFILDVLENYITYKTAWRLAHPGGEHEVDSRKASTEIARWVRLHPHNIEQKVIAIVEHFRANVIPLLDGRAKAMVVTGSRKEAVRYKLAMDSYVRQEGYGDVHPLVAFSDRVIDPDSGPEEFTESNMNPRLKGRDLREAFDTDDFNVMIVAEKFQTGFDQPKLCAMYVDKKLQGVDCVQTLSRLNRTFPGKETFVLDFVNDAEDIKEAFEPYYGTVHLTDVSDPNAVHDLEEKLKGERIFRWEEVEAFARVFFDPKGKQSGLLAHCEPARDRFLRRWQEASEAIQGAKARLKEVRAERGREAVAHAEEALQQAREERDRLEIFRKDLGSFTRFYEFISQVVNFHDEDLEKLNVFARHLLPLLRTEREETEIDLSELQLTHYRLTKQREHRLKLGEEEGEYGLDPAGKPGGAQPRDPKQERLQEIIQRLNDLFGEGTTERDHLTWTERIAGRIAENDTVMAQIRNNPRDQVMHGDFPGAVVDAVLDSMEDDGERAQRVLESENTKEEFAMLLLELLVAGTHKQSTRRPRSGEAGRDR